MCAKATKQRPNDDNEDTSDLEARKATIEQKVHSYVDVTLTKMRAASVTETQALVDGLAHLELKEEDIAGWEEYVDGTMQKQIASANELYNSVLVGNLKRLEEDKVIGRGTVDYWIAKFRDTNVDYKTKETFIEGTLVPVWMPQWREVKQRRDDLCRDPRVQALTGADIDDIDALRNADAFAKLSYREKKHLVGRVRGLVNAREGHMEALHNSIALELRGYAQGPQRILHPLKIGGWLARVFTHAHTPAEVALYMQQIVHPFVRNWRRVREAFDDVDGRLAETTPVAFRRLGVDQFLSMPFEEREGYLAAATAALERPGVRSGAETAKDVSRLMTAATRAMDLGAYETALASLDEAIALDPMNFGVTLLRKQATLKAQEAKTKPTAAAALRQMQHIVATMPHTHQQWEYAAVLERGTASASAYFTAVETGVQLTESYELTTADEEEHRDILQAEQNDTAKRTPLRTVHTQAADVLYADPLRTNALAASMEELGAQPPSPRQRICYIPEGVSLEKRKAAIVHHHTLLRCLHTLEEQGANFSMTARAPLRAAA